MSLRSLYYLPAYYLTLLLFGLGGLELSLLGLLTSWLPATDRTERFFQRLIHRHFAFFHWWCERGGLIHVRYHGFDQLPRGGVVLAANHLSLIDITCLIARLSEAICIFKPAIRHNPVLGAAARRAGYLGSDGGHDLIRAAAEKVAAGNLLVVFPAGTRTPPRSPPLPFRPGFVLIARRAHAPIQLVRLATNSDLLTKGSRWWRLPRIPVRVDVTAGPLVATDSRATPAELTAQIEAWFAAAASSPPTASLTPAESR
ncbi:MAG: 1-acyl-sn-glycerol-3-phosphate acyltransferase [Lacunisphaera sp.]|nr:1-acyl-sn-glycerol-3-phosphate acyltransferase [Lacunisphaera sp.]MDB6165724.1 1-acyl-sn-glycerol-3-phosphate acyltransferase [Lacunisphaera sp.]